MKIYRTLQNNKHITLALYIGIGVTINVALSFAMSFFGIPLYLDTVGTIFIGAMGGFFPGIVTAVLTNFLCTAFNSYSAYFSLLSIIIAYISYIFSEAGYFKSKKKLVYFTLIIALIGGIPGAFIQQILFGKSQIPAMAVAVESLSAEFGFNSFILFLILNTLLNIIDKVICVTFCIILMRVIPNDIKNDILQSVWRQKPLSVDEVRDIEVHSKNFKKSVKTRMTKLLLVSSFLLVFFMIWVGMNLYYNQAKIGKRDDAINAAKLAAEYINPEMVDDYLQKGEDTPGYYETKDNFRKIRDNFPDIMYLYALRVQRDGCHFIVDIDTEDLEAYSLGEVVPIEEAFEPYMEELLRGNKEIYVESQYNTTWLLTVYVPVKNIDGRCVCFVGADVSMSYISEQVAGFLLKILLVFAGLFILIVATGLQIASYDIAIPINSMSSRVEGFGEDTSDRTLLDESVKRVKDLRIETGDEVENLYNVLCKLTNDFSEQIKEINKYNNAVETMQQGLIVTMADLVESRDADTGAHVQKTAEYVRIILNRLNEKGYYSKKMTPKYMSDVVLSAPLHDVGKIKVPDAVLNKPGRLTDEEFEIMKSHTIAGKEIMEKAIMTSKGENYLKEARNMAAYHHEKWDGTGYPFGLKKEAIPLSARIMAVADVFDALVTKRIYKPAMPFEEAIQMIKNGSGTHFDPKCVECFLDGINDVKRVMEKYQV